VLVRQGLLICEGFTYIRARVQHSTQTKNGNNHLFLPHGPVQGIIRIFTRLWGEHDVGVSSSAMLETMGDLLSLSRLVVQQHRPRNVSEFVIWSTMSITASPGPKFLETGTNLPSRTPSPILSLSNFREYNAKEFIMNQSQFKEFSQKRMIADARGRSASSYNAG
jgi:hypothetical protein